jgi:hypothetical protein
VDCVYQTIDSERLAGIFDLPYSFMGKKLDVIILPAWNEDLLPQKQTSAFGCLREYANPSLIDQEKGAWEKAMVEKYENR